MSEPVHAEGIFTDPGTVPGLIPSNTSGPLLRQIQLDQIQRFVTLKFRCDWSREIYENRQEKNEKVQRKHGK